MKRRKNVSDAYQPRTKSRRYYETEKDMYTVSCALYRLARNHLDRCEMLELITEIMRSPSWAYTASAIARRLNRLGMQDEVRRIYIRYM